VMCDMRDTICKVRSQSGFTLVEIMITVGIIALLASMVIGLATHFDNRSKEKGLESTFAVLEGALQEYYEYMGGFPVAVNKDPNENSEILYERLCSIPSSRQVLERISDTLIQDKVETDVPEIYDLWGTVLDYRYDSNIDTFPELISAGPDRKFGTTDDISNKK